MTGKQKCKILKQIRKQIADANGIEYMIEECSHKGKCRGTCPRCEWEVRQLEKALEKRRLSGKKVALAGISAGFFLTSCTPLEKIGDLINSVHQTAGDMLPDYTEALEGETEPAHEKGLIVDEPLEGEPAEIETALPIPGELAETEVAVIEGLLAVPEDESEPVEEPLVAGMIPLYTETASEEEPEFAGVPPYEGEEEGPDIYMLEGDVAFFDPETDEEEEPEELYLMGDVAFIEPEEDGQ